MAKTRFEVYKDKTGTYRWKLLSQNGESVANGGEAYTSKSGAMNAAKKLKDWSKTKDIVDVEKAKADKIKLVEKAKALANKKNKAKSKKVISTKEKATSKDKPTSKKKNIKKAASKKVSSKKPNNIKNKNGVIDLHIVNKVDRYDGITVADAMDHGIDNVDNLLM